MTPREQSIANAKHFAKTGIVRNSATRPPPLPPSRPGLRKNVKRTELRNKWQMSQPMRGMPFISPIIRENKKIDGETYNAEGMGSGRKVIWSNKAAANQRAELIRNTGHHARVIPNKSGFTVYIGAERKDFSGQPFARFNYDWSGATGPPSQYGL